MWYYCIILFGAIVGYGRAAIVHFKDQRCGVLFCWNRRANFLNSLIWFNNFFILYYNLILVLITLLEVSHEFKNIINKKINHQILENINFHYLLQNMIYWNLIYFQQILILHYDIFHWNSFHQKLRTSYLKIPPLIKSLQTYSIL